MLLSTSHASVEFSSDQNDDTSRVGRIHPTAYSNIRQTPLNSNSIISPTPPPSSKPMPPPTSPGHQQTTAAITSKPHKPLQPSPFSPSSSSSSGSPTFTIISSGPSLSPSHKPSISSSGGSSSSSSGNTFYNIHEQMQPPAANAHHYLFPTLPQNPHAHSTPSPSHGTASQQYIPAGKYFYENEADECILNHNNFFCNIFLAGPFLMQILTPNGQPTGQIQYIQFLRPVMMPFMPLASASTTSTPTMQALPHFSASSPKFTIAAVGSPPPPPPPAALQPVAQAYTQTSASIAQQYAPAPPPPPPQTTTTISDGGFYPYTQQLQHQQTQPVASFSAPVASYYHPQVYSTNRIRLISGPGELSLNTNEYVPASSEISYSAIKPIRA